MSSMPPMQIDPRLMGVAPTLAPAPPAMPTPMQDPNQIPGTAGLTPPGIPGPSPAPMIGAGPVPGQDQGFGQGPDPVLSQLLQQPPQEPLDPEALLPKSQRKGYMKMPDAGYIDEVINADLRRYERLIARFTRDLALYEQQDIPNVPPGFDPLKEIAFRQATISNVVNKLTNMSSAADWRYVVPFQDEKSKINSQITENWYSYLRNCELQHYAEANGESALQWREFWYLYQMGHIVSRILPDPEDANNPFHDDLIDPAVCYPTFSGTKKGMVRMSMIFEAKVVDVLEAYARYDPGLEDRIAAKIGYKAGDEGRYYNQVGTVKEWWSTWNRRVTFRDVEVLAGDHELGYIPFVYMRARGEPAGHGMPRNGTSQIDEYSNAVFASGTRENLEEKGVSVFHHIRNTHRMSEIVFTLMLSEVLKAQNPAVIEYMAPQLWGNPPPPMKHGPGASNRRVLNAQQVEIVPTSPRPTDVSPVLNKVQADTVEGSINPAMYGSMDGSNIAGFAVESLISAARDTVLPYTQAFQDYQAAKAKIKAKMYVTHIAPLIGTMSVPMEGQYGSGPSADVTPEIVKSTGYKVSVEMIGVSDAALPAMMNVSAQAVKEGLWSRRKAMEKLGEKDPQKMLQDIIIERAIEHPEIMENVIIPQMFAKNGQNELAYLWGMMVVMPKMMQTIGSVMGGAGGMTLPGMSGGGGQPPSGPPPGSGQPPGATPRGPRTSSSGGTQGSPGQTMTGMRGNPTGPLPGQGRS